MTISLGTRFAVMKRDRFTCVYCGAHPPQVQIEVDHFHPASRGGPNDEVNLVTACIECNRGKGTTLWDDYTEAPGEDSALWKWVTMGEGFENHRIRDAFLNRDDRTFSQVFEALWPEVDY